MDKAIDRGHFMRWPGLIAARVRKHLAKSEMTAMGHLKQVQQGIRSTSKGDTSTNTTAEDAMPTVREASQNQNVIVCSAPITGSIGTDQTRRFPAASVNGHKHTFISCNVNSGQIHSVSIESRKASELVRACGEAHKVLAERGFTPLLHRLDDETSTELVKAIKDQGLTHETVPPTTTKPTL